MLDNLGPTADPESKLVGAEGLLDRVLMCVQEGASSSSDYHEADANMANRGEILLPLFASRLSFT